MKPETPPQVRSVVIDNIGLRLLDSSLWPVYDVPPPSPSFCASQLLDFDDITQLGDL